MMMIIIIRKHFVVATVQACFKYLKPSNLQPLDSGTKHSLALALSTVHKNIIKMMFFSLSAITFR